MSKDAKGAKVPKASSPQQSPQQPTQQPPSMLPAYGAIASAGRAILNGQYAAQAQAAARIGRVMMTQSAPANWAIPANENDPGIEWRYAFIGGEILEAERNGVTPVSACTRAAVLAEQALINLSEQAPALGMEIAMALTRYARNFAHRHCEPNGPNACSVANNSQKNAMRALTGKDAPMPADTRYIFGEGWFTTTSIAKHKP